MRHELRGDLFRERRLKPTSDVDFRQLLMLTSVVCFEFLAFQLKFGLFRVGLRVHRDVLTCSHRHRSGDQPCDARDQDVVVSAMRSCDSEHEAGRRKDAIVGTQYGRSEPADTRYAVLLFRLYRHLDPLLAQQPDFDQLREDYIA